jgi:hypothetical protein
MAALQMQMALTKSGNKSSKKNLMQGNYDSENVQGNPYLLEKVPQNPAQTTMYGNFPN